MRSVRKVKDVDHAVITDEAQDANLLWISGARRLYDRISHCPSVEILQTVRKHFVFGRVGICRAIQTGQDTLSPKCYKRLLVHRSSRV